MTNPAAYRLYLVGANGVFERGGGDDWLVPLGAVSYLAATHEAVLSLDGGELPDGTYVLLVSGADAREALVDLTGNPLAGGGDVAFFFAVNVAGPVDLHAAHLAGREGQAVALSRLVPQSGQPGPAHGHDRLGRRQRGHGRADL